MPTSTRWARDATNKVNTTALQAKFRLTPPSRKNGCNAGAVIGASQVNDGNDNRPDINGLLSCNRGAGSLHLNLEPITHLAGRR